jgi:prepilin-type N-terminal cleavage/methylation domain-containing protein
MLGKLKKTNNAGFTIIEVMIVLAIAGLILLIVFLAVPALQRSSRNTGRKSDAGHVSTAVNDWISNNNGSMPTLTNWGGATGSTLECPTILADAGNLSDYNSANSFACAAAGATANDGTKNVFEFGDGAAPTSTTGQAMVLDVGYTCPTTGATPVLLYTVETASGPWTWTCLTVE